MTYPVKELAQNTNASELGNLLESDKFKQISIMSYSNGETINDGVTDATTAWDTMVAAITEGSKIIFPKGTYLGNFVTTKSFDIDFCGSTLIPYDDTLPTLKFEGTIGTGLTVTGNPVYGQKDIVVSSVSGISVDDFGYLHDNAVRPADSAAVNYELIRVNAVTTATNTITINDMVRSDQNTGTCKYYPVTMIENPKIRNLKVAVSDTNTEPAVWFYGCNNPICENVEVENSTGHAVRFEFCYNVSDKDIRVLNPYATTTGTGYGLTFQKCRNVNSLNTYGIKTRHLIDCESSYNLNIDNVVGENGESSQVVLSHNGYGGNIRANNIVAECDSYAVEYAYQGITDLDLVTARDIIITNVNHVIPTRKSDEFGVSIYILPDFSNVVIKDVNIKYVDTSSTPSLDAYAVRLNGNHLGHLEIRNITVNESGTVVAYNRRSTRTVEHHNMIIDGIDVASCVYAVYLRGFYSVDIDNVRCKAASSSVYYLSNLASVTPYRASFGGNVLSNITNVFLTHTGLPTTGLRGNPPKLTEFSTGSVSLDASGSIVTEANILNGGAYLTINAPTGSDATLDGTTPLAAPIWIGQELTLVINAAGYSGTRGNVIIPTGSNTYADDGAPVTLTKANIYQLKGYNGKWRLVS